VPYLAQTSRFPKAVQALGPILGPHGKASGSNKISENRDDLADPERFELPTPDFGGGVLDARQILDLMR
jgi:hypothetical protein